jgi:GDP-mannose pyrophosphatase NudK
MKAEIIEKNILSNKWAEYAEYKIEYTRSDGRKELQKREIHNCGNGATVLLYNIEKREVLLIKQFRLATMLNGNESGVLIEACAGLIEDEAPSQSMLREIKEETGYCIEDIKFLFAGYATPGAKTEKIYFFTAVYNDNTPKNEGAGLLHEQEDIELLYLPFDDALSKIYNGEIIDLKTITLLLYAQLQIFK